MEMNFEALACDYDGTLAHDGIVEAGTTTALRGFRDSGRKLLLVTGRTVGDLLGIYSHLGMVTPALAEGKTVLAAGEKIGVVGHSGLTYGMHLYFEMLLAGRPVDPAPYLGVSLCSGAIRTRADMVASDGKIPPTRHYAGRN